MKKLIVMLIVLLMAQPALALRNKSTIKTLVGTVATANTATQLTAAVIPDDVKLIVKASSANASAIKIGGTATTMIFEMPAGSAISLAVARTDAFFFTSTTAGDKIEAVWEE